MLPAAGPDSNEGGSAGPVPGSRFPPERSAEEEARKAAAVGLFASGVRWAAGLATAGRAGNAVGSLQRNHPVRGLQATAAGGATGPAFGKGMVRWWGRHQVAGIGESQGTGSEVAKLKQESNVRYLRCQSTPGRDPGVGRHPPRTSSIAAPRGS